MRKLYFLFLFLFLFFGCTSTNISYPYSQDLTNLSTPSKTDISKYRDLDLNTLIINSKNDIFSFLKKFDNYLSCKDKGGVFNNACIDSRTSDKTTIKKVIYYVKKNIVHLNPEQKALVYKKLAKLYSYLNDEINQKVYLLKALRIDQKLCNDFNYTIEKKKLHTYCLTLNDYININNIPLLDDYMKLSKIGDIKDRISYSLKAINLIKKFHLKKRLYNKLFRINNPVLIDEYFYQLRKSFLENQEYLLYVTLSKYYQFIQDYKKAVTYLDKSYNISNQFTKTPLGKINDKITYFLLKAKLFKEIDKNKSKNYFLKVYKLSKNYYLEEKKEKMKEIKKEYNKKIKKVIECNKKRKECEQCINSKNNFLNNKILNCFYVDFDCPKKSVNDYKNELKNKINNMNTKYSFIKKCNKENFYYPCAKDIDIFLSYLDFFQVYNYPNDKKFLNNLLQFIVSNKLYWRDFKAFSINEYYYILYEYGVYFYKKKDYYLAYKYLLQSLKEGKEYFSDDPDIYYMLGISAYNLNLLEQAFMFFRICIQKYDNNFLISLDAEQKNAIIRIKNSIGYMLDIALHLGKDKFFRAIEFSMNYKEKIFETEIYFMKIYYQTNNKNLKSQIKKYFLLKRQLSNAIFLKQNFSEKIQKDKINELKLKIKSLYNLLISQINIPFKFITIQKLEEKLKPNQLFINILKANNKYYIFYIDKNSISWKIFDIQTSKKLEKYIKKYLQLIKQSTYQNSYNIIREENKISSKIFNLVFNILQNNKKMPFEKYQKIIISPDGAFKILPVGSLYDLNKKKYLIEDKEIIYIPSVRFLINDYTIKNKIKKIDIFADPKFNINLKNCAVNRGIDNSLILRKEFNNLVFYPLPGTLKEANLIKTISKQHKISYEEYIKQSANISNLLKIKSPSILHIATHGFFINSNKIKNPMLKSGIALSGANIDKKNGIVTALRISGLDLKNTNLVVLSACDTGVVDINSTDSVSALNKSFLIAGTKNIISTLWEISDKSTVKFMKEFYKDYLKSYSVSKSLRNTKIKFIKEHELINNWAPFIVYGIEN